MVLMWARRHSPRAHTKRSPGSLASRSDRRSAPPCTLESVHHGFHFHLEPFTALFALLAARDMWRDRYLLSLFISVPLTLLS